MIYKRTARSTTRPGEYVGQLLSLEPDPDPQDSPELTTGDRWIGAEASKIVSRKNAEDRVRKAAKREDLHAGQHLENDQLKRLWYLTQTSGRYQFRLKASGQTLEALVDRFQVIKPGEVLAQEISTAKSS